MSQVFKVSFNYRIRVTREFNFRAVRLVLCKKMHSGDNDKSLSEFKPYPGFATNAIHVGQEPEQWNSWPVVPPISLSTTFKQSAPGEYLAFDYSRAGNPTRNTLEATIAALDGHKYAVCFSSGCAAMCGITYLLGAGDHIICMDDVYGGSQRLLRHLIMKNGIDVDFVEASVVENVRTAIRPNTKLIWIETPTNPTLKMVDIEAVTAVARKHAPQALIAIDNTFMSPYFQRPSDYGVDMVVHSLTKYINGHSDVVMGSVSTNNEDLAQRLQFILKSFGGCPSSFDCFLVSRGIKTLALRMREHMTNGLAVARFLQDHPLVVSVIHPGLPSHPQYELGKRQMTGYSGMVSFYIKGGLAESRAFLKNMKLFVLAESLGGYESLAELPSLMTHNSVSPEVRNELGITDNLLRLSVGLEDINDIIADLDQALKATADLSSTKSSSDVDH